MSPAALFRGMDRQALDAAYNNTVAVPGSAEIVADWQVRSDRLRAARSESLNLRYGPDERNRIDYFEAAPNAPLLVFIHGGYWQMRAKENFSCFAAGPLARGVSVALAGYTLAPDKRLDGIVAEMHAALDFLHKKFPGKKLVVSGWSAGGHLTAMMMKHPAVKGGLAISGIFDLEPMRLCYLNEKLRLDEDEQRRNSPILHLPQKSAPLFVTYGKAELPELQRQSVAYWEAWSRAGLPGRLVPLEGKNHFSIMEELASPQGALAKLVPELA
jgi:acetyl esterase/lipase